MATSAVQSEAMRKGEWSRLSALLIGNFVIGTGILLPAGMLGYIAKDFDTTVPVAGWLLTASGLVVGLGSPIFAMLAGGFDRRMLLIGSMLLYAVGHVASVFAPNFAALLAIRGIMTVAAGVFTPQAAAAVGLLVPGEKRASSIAFIFLGWSLASVAGIPIGSLIASAAGWRAAFLVLVPIALIAAGLVAITIPGRMPNTPVTAASWSRILTSRAMLCLLAATVASMCGQFAVLTYMQPLLRDSYQTSALAVAGLLAIYGAAGIIGNGVASGVVARAGLDRTVHVLFALILFGMLLIGFSFGSMWVFVLGLVSWGVGSFASNSLQQARLVAIDPTLAGASVALNTSAVYLGQAVGAATGGVLFAAGRTWAFGLSAAGILLLAVLLSLAAERANKAAS